MLRARIITALVLLSLLLPALFAQSPLPFEVFTLALMAAAGWEWGRLNGQGQRGALVLGVVLALSCALTIWKIDTVPAPVWWAIAVMWILGGAAALRLGPRGWPRVPQQLRLVLGALMLWAAWLALTQAWARGLNFLLSVFCLVWMADIAAYACGKALGRRKLAPTISPGKSWEGAIGGFLGVLLLAVLWSQWLDRHLGVDSASLFQTLLQGQAWPLALLSLMLLGAMSVVGDLFESLVKRAVGAKDSSRLLPGHGGVLDRIDALLPVFPLAMALSSLS
ncbi:phosphatidate cytidylyltransferase [Roseateles sp. BYS180W]|uniref:Phosphatidate cytidylyltransferase n=1 Tax=Roseateles rivi TaxID=3299028 RepID=A0ABW7FVS6_9BURK